MFLSVGCGVGPEQPAEFLLFTRPANTIGLELHDVSGWNESTVPVGPSDAAVPVSFRWRSGFDDRNCERVEEVEVRRTGGPKDVIVEVSPTRGSNHGCNLAEGAGAGVRGAFETMVLEVAWKRGEATGGGTVAVQGNGRLTPALR